MISEQYIWLVLSLMVLAVWLVLYLKPGTKLGRREMITVSLWTSLLGLTEPLFVPEYWNPPSLFNLAQRTGFDIESFLFAFAVGGIVAVAYEALFHSQHRRMSAKEKRQPRHRWHLAVVASVPASFILLWFITPFNPIYDAAIALLIGFFTTCYCRPNLVKKMLVSAGLFTIIYGIITTFFDVIFPGYIEAVWNLPALSGRFVGNVPIEELIWAGTFGLYWSSVYEHFGWRRYVIKNKGLLTKYI